MLARYFVLDRGDSWLVTLEGRIMTRAPSRTEAVEAAIIMADLMGAMHHEADVMVEESGQLQLVWSHGLDLLPGRLRQGTQAAPAAHPHIRLVQRGEALAS